jgi:hypothetical protein
VQGGVGDHRGRGGGGGGGTRGGRRRRARGPPHAQDHRHGDQLRHGRQDDRLPAQGEGI